MLIFAEREKLSLVEQLQVVDGGEQAAEGGEDAGVLVVYMRPDGAVGSVTVPQDMLLGDVFARIADQEGFECVYPCRCNGVELDPTKTLREYGILKDAIFHFIVPE